MRTNFVLAVLVLWVVLTILLFIPVGGIANEEGCLAKGCLATGITSTGSGATTSRGSAGCGYSQAAGTIATHTAYAEHSKGSYFAGFSFNTNNTGQGIFAGTGLGKEGSSLELVLTMADVSEFSDFLISAKYQFLGETPSRPGLAVGIDAINEIPEQMQSSPYVVASKCLRRARLPLLVSLGWGSGRFQDRLFGSLAFILSRRWNFIVEYDGVGGNVGVSFATELLLWRPLPVVAILAVHNAFASDEESTFGVGAGIRFP